MNASIVPHSSQEYKRMRTQDRLFERAATLWEEGYRCTLSQACARPVLRLTAPNGACYLVDMERHSCECVSFGRGEYRAQGGRCWCKHLLGGPLLALSQAEELEQQADAIRTPITHNIHNQPLGKWDHWMLRLGSVQVLRPADRLTWLLAAEMDRKARVLRELAEAEQARRARRRAA